MTHGVDLDLAEDCAKFYADPLGFVLWAFDWGQGELADFKGPRDWQLAYLEDLGAQITERGFDGLHPVAPMDMATASGHGIGKSAMSAWLILFIMSTRPFAKGVVTSNTSDQLRTKTWAELGKWHKRCLTGHWFSYSASKGNMALVHKRHPESWRCDAQTCREENSESFAGLHAANSTPFYLFDEASAVPDKIWEVSDGGLTDGEPMRFVFGNPTRNSGRFFECFNRLRHRWKTRQIDSRSVRGTNQKLMQQWVEDYGEDSDFVRVRVRGVFPRAGSTQFISGTIVEEAQKRQLSAHPGDTIVIGVDVARFGDDQSVILVRQGRKVLEITKYRIDTMTLVGHVIEIIRKWNPDGVLVDGVGVGGGVVDRLKQLGHDCIDVNAGARAQDQKTYMNKRAEMWGKMRDWLKGGDIPADDQELETDLTAIEYGFDAKNRLQLERKEDMKKRGLHSPDVADALALTFAEGIVKWSEDYYGDMEVAISDYEPGG
ncbi:terminase [Kiloniella litopenaei]|uniref:Terminase n=1 Tax=Kiloniella litopenaei TaxID=1549748 RepID=A0A0M2RGE3_9PROT|nr:terminase [Kiloniella litopenaei]KKJ78638.1 terminase [Kiloniella litopenaei]